MGRPPSDLRARALDAATRIVLRDGVATLTLDAVAREVGTSKGGLLYHFGTKEALLRALVAEAIADFDAQLMERVARDPEPHGRLTRAFVETTLGEETDARHAALLAAVAADLSLLEPLRERHRALIEATATDGLDPVAETLIRAAADGLWVFGLFGMPTPKVGLGALRDRLVAMTRPSVARA